MANYNKSVNFAVKDTLQAGDPQKIVSGAEIDTEFNNISSSSTTKADKAANPITDNISTLTSLGDPKNSGVSIGNDSGQVPLSNGTTNSNLNADLLDGEEGSFYQDYNNLNNAPTLNFGSVQITGYVNGFDQDVNFTAPDGSFLVGEASIHTNNNEDRRFRFRYRSISFG